MLSKRYRFYIQSATINGGVQLEVFPSVEDITYKGDKTELFRSVEKTMSNEIVLSGADYTALNNLEISGNNCDAVNFYVDIFNGTTYVRDFTGLVKLKKSEFDRNKCTAKLGIEPKTESYCFIGNLKEKINLIEAVAFKPVAYSAQGTLEQITCGYTAFSNIQITNVIHPFNNTCITAGQGWTMYENRYRNITAGTPSGFFNVEIQTKFARQVVTSVLAPTYGTGWINIGGGQWARPVTVTAQSLSGDYGNPLGGDITEINTIDIWGANTAANAYTNGMYLSDIFAALVGQNACNYQIVSNYFGINNDGTNPTNIAYTHALAKLQRLIVWQITDVKRWDDPNAATKAETTLEDFFKDIEEAFNASIDIEVGTPNKIRIEHLSYWQQNGLDLTTRWNDVIEANAYKYNEDKLPRRESVKWANETDGIGGYFDGYEIKYNENCTDPKEEKIIQPTQLTTNFEGMYENANVSETGFAIAATILADSQNIILSNTKINDELTVEKMIDNVHYYHRVLNSGTYNGASKTFVESPKKIEQVKVENFTPLENFAFNPNLRVQTKLGWGEVIDYEYSAKNCILSLTLLQ